MTVVVFEYPSYSLYELDMKIWKEELVAFFFYLLLHPNTHLFDCDFVLDDLLLILQIVKIVISYLPELSIVFQLNAQKFAVIVTHMSEKVGQLLIWNKLLKYKVALD